MRYVILVLLNTPVILLAFLNILTRYKMDKMPKQRFRRQLFLWALILIVLVCSFPFYNKLHNRPLLDSTDLSAFDIIQTTVIIGLVYILNTIRQKLEETERRLRDLHQELSIKLSK
jgi:uncharacterized membrane protein YhaH (DUF805 family)